MRSLPVCPPFSQGKWIEILHNILFVLASGALIQLHVSCFHFREKNDSSRETELVFGGRKPLTQLNKSNQVESFMFLEIFRKYIFRVFFMLLLYLFIDFHLISFIVFYYLEMYVWESSSSINK